MIFVRFLNFDFSYYYAIVIPMTEQNFIRKNPDGSTITGGDYVLGKLDKTNMPNDVILNDAQTAVIASPVTPFALIDTDAPPHTPIADQRIERFLMAIVEDAITKTPFMYSRYKVAGFTLTGIEMQDKNTMRFLLSIKRVKDRWNYLKESEWDLRKPTKLSLQTAYEIILDDPETRPADKLKAIEGLTKLLGLSEESIALKGGGTTVIFNSIDKPRVTQPNPRVLDVTSERE